MTFARCFLLVASLLSIVPAHAATAAAEPLACTGRRTGAGSGELACPVPAGGGWLRITAAFSGVHDDSQAAVLALLDDKPVACEPGAKLRITGEDEGDTLTCRFRVGAQDGGAARSLALRLVWHHAEPTAIQVVPVQQRR
jgi:hypothetical protein